MALQDSPMSLMSRCVFALGFFATAVVAQAACGKTIAPASSPAVAAKGFTARIVANGLTNPRGMVFDKEGNLLVVQNGKGVTALKLKDDGGTCVSVAQSQIVIPDTSLNHAIQLSADGRTIYASSADKVFSYEYDAKALKTSRVQTLIQGMYNSDHSSRTLLLSKKAPGMLLVSRGSAANIDNQAKDLKSAHSQIRAFNVNQLAGKTVQYSDGQVIAWGLRNSVGLDEDPVTGAIYSNENGSDGLIRDGRDIHENSPGEEINFHGYLNGTKHPNQGKNFGYPDCAAAWNVKDMPRNSALTVGKQFYLGASSANFNDTTCQKDYVAPRLTLPAHWAPIDIKFNSKGTVAYMTSRGSWNKASPDGYMVFAISFANGDPVHPPSSTTAAIPILSNQRVSSCPGACFRPTGLAWDSKGRLYMASDKSGEIYVIGRTDGKSVDSVTLEQPGGKSGA